MLNDRLSTLKKIYGAKANLRNGPTSLPPARNARNDSAVTKFSLKSIGSTATVRSSHKHGPATSTTLPPAIPQFGGRMSAYRSKSVLSSKWCRSPSRERLDDLHEEMLNAKKSCSRLNQENTVLRTRLRKLQAQSSKREQHLQSLLHQKYEPAESQNTNEAMTMIGFKQKLLKSQILIREQQEVIRELKDNGPRSRRESLSQSREPTPKRQKSAMHRSQSMDHITEENNRLKEQLLELKRENKSLRAQIAKLQAQNRPDSELSEWPREDLVRLVQKLEARNLKVPIRAAVAKLGEVTEVGKISRQLDEVKETLTGTIAENEKLKKEIRLLAKELNKAQLAPMNRPPQVPPLDMKSIENSVESPEIPILDEDEDIIRYDPESELEYDQDQPSTSYEKAPNFNLISSCILSAARAHNARLKYYKRIKKENDDYIEAHNHNNNHK